SLGLDLGKFGPNKDGIDGQLGRKTEAAIRAAQKRLGMPQTGVATPKFLDKLADAVERDKAKKNGKQTLGKAKPTQTTGSASTPKSGLGPGDSGDGVRELQRLMSALGVKTSTNGTFDASTEAAVKEIQRKLGMKRPSGKARKALINKMLAGQIGRAAVRASDERG